jgi:hypothetical protein
VEANGGPYLDDKGQIHMLANLKVGDIQKTKLNTVFFNIAMQGNMRNEGMQKAINDQALKNLEKIANTRVPIPDDFITHFDNLKRNLDTLTNKTILFFDTASANASLDSLQCIASLGGYRGMNCYGGKDRTGYGLALNTHSVLRDEVGDTEENRNLLSEWGHELLSEKGIAANVAKENADHTVLKLTAPMPELYNRKMLRTSHAIKGLALKMKSSSVSPAKGQLYKAQADIINAKKIQMKKNSSAKMTNLFK